MKGTTDRVQFFKKDVEKILLVLQFKFAGKTGLRVVKHTGVTYVPADSGQRATKIINLYKMGGFSFREDEDN